MWERGLKSISPKIYASESASLPLWERGLKYFADGTEYMVDYVAPLVGAWIEMDLWDV